MIDYSQTPRSRPNPPLPAAVSERLVEIRRDLFLAENMLIDLNRLGESRGDAACAVKDLCNAAARAMSLAADIEAAHLK